MISGFKGSAMRSGFTLVEVMAAMILLSFGVLSLVRVTGALALEMRRAGSQTAVVATAQTGLEDVEVQAFEAVTVGTTVDTVRVQGRDFVRTVTVSAAGARVKRVEVAVVPAVPPGPALTLTTYVHKRW
jgi:prepilin-type N-terminal cleavage/methylation domain-containing protein